MKNNAKQILAEAQSTLDFFENGKTYPVGYVINRFASAAAKNSKDQLIGNMRDAIVKIAKKQEFISQKEIGKMFDDLYGISGGHTAFRSDLEDLLPENRQFAKVAYKNSSKRTLEENEVNPIHKDSELSNAFSVLFSLGGDSAFNTYKIADNKQVEKTVFNKLNSLGHPPLGVDIIQTNDHYTLCAANYQTSTLKKVSIFIPVQTTDGIVQSPNLLVMNENVVELDARNLYCSIKEQEKFQSSKKFAHERNYSAPIEADKKVVPNSLKQFTDLETGLVVAASKFGKDQVQMGFEILNAELNSLGFAHSNIKVAGANAQEIIYNVYLPTKLGESLIEVPLEIHNNRPILPIKFASKTLNSDKQIFSFSSEGFSELIKNLTPSGPSLLSARDTGQLSTMSYQQLMDQMITGISNKDYKIAEDILQVIEKRFGVDTFKVAFDQFSQMLKHSSENASSRQEFIKMAFERGDLIKVPTSIELYCPKLGLPVSKIDFDERGRVTPKGRHLKNQIQDTLISTNKIVLT